MKSGAGDDPFADEPPEAEDTSGDAASDTDVADEASAGIEGGAAANVSELPYKYRRESVKEGRSQQPMFIQSETEDRIDEAVADVESQFEERVYKTDVVEALIVAGAEGIEPEAVLRRWGYGMKNS
ncbi:hypothetical protein [Haloarcula litorea]|uniref:hypothetical protein n=1 Tax=Haloarcula litorea TaxID=3032579 RepID=UPI0023E8DB44|nr:hypothetical protein [Halomicroarcula sp. GDY20]